MNKGNRKKNLRQANKLTDEEVRTFLTDNADFFDRHPELLGNLEFPHESGGATSLIDKQISVLRKSNVELIDRIDELTINARINNTIFENTRALIISLLDAKNLLELDMAFADIMEKKFNVEHHCLIIYGNKKTKAPIRREKLDVVSKKIGAIIKGQKPVCGALRNTELKFLFPKLEGDGSAAVIPLGQEENLGLFAIGNTDATYYNSDMGTLFLSHIGEILLRVIPALMQESKN